MNNEKKHVRKDNQMDKHVNEVLKVLRSIDSHLASMVYEATPSRGFAADIERALAQPFTGDMNENKDILESMIREQIKKSLGDK